MADLSTLIPLIKVDAERRLVIGRAAMEQLDRSGEIMDYATAKPAFQTWSDTFFKATNGMSKGNVRVMHGKHVAGKLTEMTFHDGDKAIDVVAHIADDNEWRKVQAGLYTGFSIGGGYAKRWEEGGAKRYTPTIMELSLVDLPCIPGAQFVELVKAGGIIETMELHPGTLEAAIAPPTFGKIWSGRPLSFAELQDRQDAKLEAAEEARPRTFGEMMELQKGLASSLASAVGKGRRFAQAASYAAKGGRALGQAAGAAAATGAKNAFGRAARMTRAPGVRASAGRISERAAGSLVAGAGLAVALTHNNTASPARSATQNPILGNSMGKAHAAMAKMAFDESKHARDRGRFSGSGGNSAARSRMTPEDQDHQDGLRSGRIRRLSSLDPATRAVAQEMHASRSAPVGMKDGRSSGRSNPSYVAGALTGATGGMAINSLRPALRARMRPHYERAVSESAAMMAHSVGAAGRHLAAGIGRNMMRAHGPAMLMGAALGAASAHRLLVEGRGRRGNAVENAGGDVGDTLTAGGRVAASFGTGTLIGGVGAGLLGAASARHGAPIHIPLKGAALAVGGLMAARSAIHSGLRWKAEHDRRRDLPVSD